MTAAGCADYFSANAPCYNQFRPAYPDALFDQVAALAPSRELAWDCATGNGQAVAALACRFRRVLASDASAAQLAEARCAGNVALFAARAERLPVGDGCVDVIIVAQALHWFSLEDFFGEARRVLRAGGVLATWTYNLFTVTPAIDRLVRDFYDDVVGTYWPAQRRLVDDDYASIAFPFDALTTTRLPMALEWSVEHLLAYIATWSAVIEYRRHTGADPLAELVPEIRAAWGSVALRAISWPLTLKTMRA